MCKYFEHNLLDYTRVDRWKVKACRHKTRHIEDNTQGRHEELEWEVINGAPEQEHGLLVRNTRSSDFEDLR
jgi:hypothetical protein